ncbi:MAG TPA: hypothetical protein PLR81_03955, partial [Treponemataceae bacterium]|nr:hypothetical protein [Treponemataceae bacterium]
QSLELDPGSTVYPMRLMKQSIDFPNGNQEIEEAIGLLVLKEGERVPEEKRIVPDWILTADSEGKILLSKPTDRLRYVFMPGGPM